MTTRLVKIPVPAAAARRFLIHTHALTDFQSLPDVAEAIARLEFVQEDSIAVCGRIHDLILWSRVAQYAPDRLHRTLYPPSAHAFEYYFPNLCALPIADYPHFVAAMHRRRSDPSPWRRLLPEEEPIARKILERIDSDGPLRTRAAGKEDGHTRSGWGTRTTVAARVTEKLWLQGHLAIARRENFERYFDRTERVYPDAAAWHAPDASLPDTTETARYLTRKRLRARRLFRLQKGEAALLDADELARVEIEGAGTWHCLASDVDALSTPFPSDENLVHLLAPLDPLIYDRARTRALFDFDYIWEVYTPAAKRRRGYYALPILFGERIVGFVDPKFDRATATLRLNALVLEAPIAPAPLIAPLAARLRAFAAFLGATTIEADRVEPAALREAIT